MLITSGGGVLRTNSGGVPISSGGGGGGGTSGEFNVVIVGSPDFQIVATSLTGEALTSGTFTIPTAGTYTATLHNLDGAERSITISSGSISKTGDSNPWTVDSGNTVGDLTIVASGSNATVTIS